jgi:hypothetical protein
MSYLHIPNLYQDQRILAFRECFAMEKIDGSSANIQWACPKIQFSSGGANRERFLSLFNPEHLATALTELFDDPVTIYGEAYGGKMQGMSATYGEELRFIVFEVKVNNVWLAVPQAEDVARKLGLEFVHYTRVPTDLLALDNERDADSVQAIRNGAGPGKRREGVVLRPPFEVVLNSGDRLIAKHKRDEFRETKTPRTVGKDPLILENAQRVAEEWVTPMRLKHVLQRLPTVTGIEHTGAVVQAMVEDVLREGAGEVTDSRAVRKAVSSAAAAMWKKQVQVIQPCGEQNT